MVRIMIASLVAGAFALTVQANVASTPELAVANSAEVVVKECPSKKGECKKGACDKKKDCDKGECKKSKGDCKKGDCDKKKDCDKGKCKKEANPT